MHPNQKDALLYGASAIATRALSFLLLPVYSRVLTPSEFGLVSIALVISGLLQMILLPGIEGLYLRYGFQGYSKENLIPSPMVGTLVRCHLSLIILILPAIGFLAVEFSRKYSPEVPSLFIVLAIAILALDSLQAPLVARFKASSSVKKLALFELTQLIFTAGIILASLFWFRLGPVSLLLGNFGSAVLFLPVTARESIKNIRVAGWVTDSFKTVAKSFLAIGPEAIFYWALTAVDRYYLNLRHGSVLTGLYVAGYQFGSAIVSLLSIGARQWKVIVYQTYVDRRFSQETLKTFYRETFILFFLLASFLAIVSRPLAMILLGKRFALAQEVIPVVMLIVSIRIPMAFFSMHGWAKQLRREVMKWNAIALIVLLLSLVVLVPSLGMTGAAWSGFIACLPFTIVLQKIREFRFDRTYFKPALVFAVVGLVVALFANAPLEITALIGIGLLGFLFVQVRKYFSLLAAF